MTESNMGLINDKNLITQAEEASKSLRKTYYQKYYEEVTGETLSADSESPFPFPLDEEAIKKLGELLPQGKTTIPYSKADDLNELWITLIEKSIQCLRFFEDKETLKQDMSIFEEKKKLVEAYEIESLKDYQKHYVEFECMLYGQNERYRDHVFHAFRVWLIGVFALTKNIDKDDETPLIDKLELDGGAKQANEKLKAMNRFEWLSMWTIAALCHDLGYPLELIGSVLDKTNEMMSDFFPRSNVSDNFTFTGIQNVINDHILKFMCTKIEESTKIENDSQGKTDGQEETGSHNEENSQEEAASHSENNGQEKTNNSENDKNYLGKIQQKYYFKYAKALENSDHGIISAVIVFKKLPFFLETDFNLNNSPCDYSETEAHQFYIRREILRAMASHNCEDIYITKIQTLPALLFICDELQEWGRKAWKNLYTDTNPSETKLSIGRFDDEKVEIIETVEVKVKSESKSELESELEAIKKKLVEKLEKEHWSYRKYKTTFRYGPDTAQREFNFNKKTEIKLSKSGAPRERLVVEYGIPRNAKGQAGFFDQADDEARRKKIEELVENKINDLSRLVEPLLPQ